MEPPRIAVRVGVAIAVLSIPVAGLAGSPYLSAGSINPGVILFAISLFAALFASPWEIRAMLHERRPKRAEDWEPAMVIWGGVGLAVLSLGLLVAWAGGFSTSSLGGTLGIVTAVEAALVSGALAFLILSN